MTHLLFHVTHQLAQRPSAYDPYLVHVLMTTVAILALGAAATAWRARDRPVARRVVAWAALALAGSLLVHGATLGFELGGAWFALPGLLLAIGAALVLAAAPAAPDRPQTWALPVALMLVGGLGSAAIWMLIGLATMR